MLHEQITHAIIHAALAIHTRFGPGLLESTYRELLCHQLTREGWYVEKEKTMPLEYEGLRIEHSYRLDLLVDGKVVVELKSCVELLQIHYKQLMPYLRLGNFSAGLLINFDVPSLKYGLRRISNVRKL